MTQINQPQAHSFKGVKITMAAPIQVRIEYFPKAKLALKET